jgi:hypothetical protein
MKAAEVAIMRPPQVTVSLATAPSTAAKRRFKTSKAYGAAGRVALILIPSIGTSYRLIYRGSLYL